MKKQLLTVTLFAFILISAFAQQDQTWYDNNSAPAVDIMNFTTTCTGCSIETVANPVATDVATSPTVLKFALSAGNDPVPLDINFSFDEGLTAADVVALLADVRFYFPDYAAIVNFDSLRRFRMYFGDAVAIEFRLQQANEGAWYTLAFDFSTQASKATEEVYNSGYFRVVYQTNRYTGDDDVLNSGAGQTKALEFYIDTIKTNKTPDQTLSLGSEEFDSNTLKILSNPVSNILEISKQVKSATIYRVTGQKLKEFTSNTKFDVSNLATGVYIVNAKLENGSSQSIRFIKN